MQKQSLAKLRIFSKKHLRWSSFLLKLKVWRNKNDWEYKNLYITTQKNILQE